MYCFLTNGDFLTIFLTIFSRWPPANPLPNFNPFLVNNLWLWSVYVILLKSAHSMKHCVQKINYKYVTTRFLHQDIYYIYIELAYTQSPSSKAYHTKVPQVYQMWKEIKFWISAHIGWTHPGNLKLLRLRNLRVRNWSPPKWSYTRTTLFSFWAYPASGSTWKVVKICKCCKSL